MRETTPDVWSCGHKPGPYGDHSRSPKLCGKQFLPLVEKQKATIFSFKDEPGKTNLSLKQRQGRPILFYMDDIT